MTPLQFLYWQSVDLAAELHKLRNKISRAAERGRNSPKWQRRAETLEHILFSQHETLRLAG